MLEVVGWSLCTELVCVLVPNTQRYQVCAIVESTFFCEDVRTKTTAAAATATSTAYVQRMNVVSTTAAVLHTYHLRCCCCCCCSHSNSSPQHKLMQSVVTGQAPITLEWKKYLGKKIKRAKSSTAVHTITEAHLHLRRTYQCQVVTTTAL